jgi:hypothetical protein
MYKPGITKIPKKLAATIPPKTAVPTALIVPGSTLRKAIRRNEKRIYFGWAGASGETARAHERTAIT